MNQERCCLYTHPYILGIHLSSAHGQLLNIQAAGTLTLGLSPAVVVGLAFRQRRGQEVLGKKFPWKNPSAHDPWMLVENHPGTSCTHSPSSTVKLSPGYPSSSLLNTPALASFSHLTSPHPCSFPESHEATKPLSSS